MSLVVEDGTGLPDAESYASVSQADAYFAARGVVAWAGTTEAKEQALRRATDYMSATFGLLWRSQRSKSAQALDWPRVGWAGVPETIKRACMELALRAQGLDLAPDVGAQVKRETVGPISVEYQDWARQSTRYVFVWGLLGPYLRDENNIPVLRAA